MVGPIKVLVVDDEASAIEEFLERHEKADKFRMEAFDGPCLDLAAHLEASIALPDLLVVDLYRTKEEPGSPEAEEVNACVDTMIKVIDRRVARLARLVDDEKDPVGLKLVERIRASPNARVREIPIMLITRQGLALLKDEELKRSLKPDVTWMVKNRSADYERSVMGHVVQKARSGRALARDVVLMLVGAGIGVIASVLVAVFSGSDSSLP
jgi:CheY-like chemotaxis protein